MGATFSENNITNNHKMWAIQMFRLLLVLPLLGLWSWQTPQFDSRYCSSDSESGEEENEGDNKEDEEEIDATASVAPRPGRSGGQSWNKVTEAQKSQKKNAVLETERHFSDYGIETSPIIDQDRINKLSSKFWMNSATSDKESSLQWRTASPRKQEKYPFL